MKKVLSVFLVLGLLLNSVFAGNVPTIQTKDYKQKQKITNLYEQIHEFLLYQYTLANTQNKIILKKILNLPVDKLIIKAYPFENKICFFDKAKENFISFNNQEEIIKSIINYSEFKNILVNKLHPGEITKDVIIVGVTVTVIGNFICRIITTYGLEICYDQACKIVKTWQTSTVIGHVPPNNNPAPGSQAPNSPGSPHHTPVYRIFQGI